MDALSMKITMLGDPGVGKTSIVERYVNNIFNSSVAPSKGAAFVTKQLCSTDGKLDLRLLIWDTAGQELFRSMASLYYKDADAIILVFDIFNVKSFESLSYWLKEIHERTSLSANIIIAGNKSDCVTEGAIDPGVALEFAQKSQAKFMLVSAKSNSSIKELFDTAISMRYPDHTFVPARDSLREHRLPSEARRPTESFRMSAEFHKLASAQKRDRPKKCGC